MHQFFCEEKKWAYLVLEKGNRWWCWPPLLSVSFASPLGFSLLFCFCPLVQSSFAFQSPVFPLCYLLSSSPVPYVLPLSVFFPLFHCPLCFSLLSRSPLFSLFFFFSCLSLPVLCVSLFSFLFSQFSFSPPSLPFFHRLSLAFISQRMACGATSNLVTACRGIVAVKHSS